jgi:hypothetical protein
MKINEQDFVKELDSLNKNLIAAGNMFSNGYTEKSDKLVKRNYKKINSYLG